MAESTRPLLPEPVDPALTFQGERITPSLIIRLSQRARAAKQESRRRITLVRALRRMDDGSLVQLAAKWADRNPEAAGWVREVLEQRVTLERDLIARIGAVEPEFSREAQGHRDRDRDDAEACEAYMEEWRLQSVPTQRFFGKGVEDGEFARVTLPAHLDMDGCPDFFEMLDERAYDALPSSRRTEYAKDDGDRKGRYVKVDEKGEKKKNPRFDKGDEDASREAHDEAVRRYLLETDARASTTRIIPALDCAPIFVRGKDRESWELVGLVECTLYRREELLYHDYGSPLLGDRRFIPLAYDSGGRTSGFVSAADVGEGEHLRVYTAYLVCKDAEGRKRPITATTIGGAATWDATTGDEHDPHSVCVTDYYEALKAKDDEGRETSIEGPLWSYHFGLGTTDDDPDYAGQPYLWPFYHRIRAIEGKKTAINAATAVNAFTGYWEEIDPRFGDGDLAEAVIEADGALRRARIPGVGEIEPSIGRITPAQQATVGQDAWRDLAADMQALQQATSVDQGSGGQGPSGHAMVVAETIAQVTKRAVRDAAKDAVVRSGEDHLKILTALYYRFKVKWPLRTVRERPVRSEPREGREVMEFDPAWTKESAFKLMAEYPAEPNLAERDLESSMQLRGHSTIERVAKASGEKDTSRFRKELLKDKLHAMPEIQMRAMMRIARQAGDREMQQILKLQQAQMMSAAQVPGVEGGVPTAALRGQGEQMEQGGGAGPGGPSIASSIRGGIEGAQQGAATLEANAQAAMAGGGA